MGNNQSLRRSIQKEQWHDVRLVLSEQDGRSRARTKTYTVSEETVTALHLACLHKAPADVIHTLIAIGQPMMESSPSQFSPLHCCLTTRSTASPDTVRLLLDSFPHDVAKPSSRVMGSKTPLHMACEQKASSVVIQMLHDADPSVVEIHNVQGQTALDVARLHPWLFHPKWRRKVKRILVDGHAANNNDEQGGVSMPEAVPEVPSPPHPPSSSSSSSSARRRPSSRRPSSPPIAATSAQSSLPTPVATATLVAETNTAAYSQLPVAAATLVEPTAPPDTLDNNSVLEKKGVCVLCWENQAEMALVPCGHVCLCTRCCQETQVLNAALNHACPICRSTFKQTLRVYPAGISR